MSNQYFENNPNLISDIHEIKYYYKNTVLSFYSDAGVFSKTSIDFGTSLMLKTIALNQNVKTVLDVGCGYGPIGITLAKIYPFINVDMIDVNLRAIELAIKNSIVNKVENVCIFASNIYEKIVKKYDVIITNPPIRAGKVVVHKIILDAINYLNKDGIMYCVIQKKQGALSAIKALEEIYRNVEVLTKDKQYFIIAAHK